MSAEKQKIIEAGNKLAKAADDVLEGDEREHGFYEKQNDWIDLRNRLKLWHECVEKPHESASAERDVREYTMVNVPQGTVKRLNVSEQFIRELTADHGRNGWRTARMGDVLVLHSRPVPITEYTDPNPVAEMEHAAAELLHCWKNGHETTTRQWERLDEGLALYREGGAK